MTPQIDHRLLHFIEQWRAAEERGDSTTLDRLLTADFTAVGPRGLVLSRERWLGRYTSGAVQTTSFKLGEVLARSYGDVTVVIAEQTQQSTNNGADATGDFRFTLIVAGHAGEPRLAGLHISPNTGAGSTR